MKIKNLGYALLAASTLAGCGSKGQRPDYERVLNEGPKALTVHVSSTGVGVGPEKRFYDVDGDGKTVEQYVELLDANMGMGRPYEIKANLVRQGAFNEERAPFNPSVNGRLMTSTEADSLDRQYQSLLNILN
tara:strand:- start:790 stop:1185 length:396 start_codon:yes stop_codon:yes gene_type:complete